MNDDDATAPGADRTLSRMLSDQLDWHWQHHLRPRLRGLPGRHEPLTDDEYLWEPVPDTWSVRPRGTSTAPVQAGSGDFTIDFAFPEPTPAPLTTIAWRLGHVIVGCLAVRNAAHFGAPAASYESWEYAGDAAGALDQLDEQIAVWLAGVRGLDDDGLARPVGPAEPYPDAPMTELVLHINRELIHHLSEVCLLRDLYLHSHSPSQPSPVLGSDAGTAVPAPSATTTTEGVQR
ncbi:DinB family protein [Myceligenerans pegani]|uniref:DinB family protein n=1 Tax=Myceligenerans pegani TaxID=2776917 RepID=A0ABR9N0Q8_9MICO|nr:DinB family protein [Myceligenerans sp. TRM 65318]MBE1876866.1 DinB family protein [Myceligenerans sp. TRM 65318]MBE3019137.1 DinB family protein [Myceligenerans sp. TRM 65318]